MDFFEYRALRRFDGAWPLGLARYRNNLELRTFPGTESGIRSALALTIQTVDYRYESFRTFLLENNQ
jgi:hypothetical protein